MAPKLEKALTRETTINDVEAYVTLSPEGFSFKKKGTRSATMISFTDLVKMVHENIAKGVQTDEDKNAEKHLRKSFNLEMFSKD